MNLRFYKHKVSNLFQPVVKLQKEEVVKYDDILSRSQKLMLDLGIIRQSSPGNYTLLPLGVRAYEKLVKHVDREMHIIDAQKIVMPSLSYEKLFKATGRITNTTTELFRLVDRHKIPYVLSPTHEEAVTNLITSLAPISYKQFPLRLYQVTSKFRDEMKPRFGLMRGRQFFMKDLYCFDVDFKSAKQTYDLVHKAYDNIFKDIGLDFIKVVGSTGDIGGTISHEYHFIANIGEDSLLVCDSCDYKGNTELSGIEICPKCKSEMIRILKGIEVGHTFLLGEKYSKPLEAMYINNESKPVYLQMGSYGLGLSRIMAAGIEILCTDNEIRWPSLYVPFKIVIIPPKLGSKEESCALNLINNLSDALMRNSKIIDDTLIDDRTSLTIGKRFLHAKRTGIPYVIVIGQKAADNPPLFEIIDVHGNDKKYLSFEQCLDFIDTIIDQN